jgi:hypothetical protein
LRKEKNVELTFQDFGVRGFHDFKSQTSTIQIANNSNNRNSEKKRKERGTNISGFQDFGVSGFQMPNNNTQQFPNSER